MPVDPKTVSGSGPTHEYSAQGPQDQRSPAWALDINQASEPEIAEIDMIGKKLAHAIVEARTRQGGFSSWEELAQVPGIDAMRIAELQRAAKLGTPRA